jgi:hypothetical protein
MGFLIRRKKKMLSVARAKEDSVSGRHMNVLVIKQNLEVPPVNDNELIIVLKSRSACAARRVQNVSDNGGATPHPQIFLSDILQLFRPGS